jgi:hypothetical protein
MRRAFRIAARLVVVIGLLDDVAWAQGDRVSTGRRVAESDREAAAWVSFRLGRELLAKGAYEAAAREFEESVRLDPGAGTMLNVAYCYELLGRGFRAWTAYRAAAALAHENGKLQWEKAALARSVQVDASLAHIVIDLDEKTDSTEIDLQLDGVLLPPTIRAKPVPVEAGRHELRASAGERHGSVTFEITKDERGDIRIASPGLEGVPGATPIASAVGVQPSRARSEPPFAGSESRADRTRAPERSKLLTAAVVATGVGGASLALAGALGLWAKSTYDGEECPAGGHCTSEGVRANSRAYLEAGAASVAAVVGLTALVGATIFWTQALAPSREIRVLPVAGPSAAGLSMVGAW